jgi:hypothetical protein
MSNLTVLFSSLYRDCATSSCIGGVCRCNTVSNDGCILPQVCQGTPPECQDQDRADPLPINAACQNSAQCQHGNCYNGECRCNVNTNAGCPVGRCGFAPGYANPECLLAKDQYGCSNNAQCTTGYCFDADDDSSTLADGTCTCHPDHNHGCSSGETCDVPSTGGAPICVPRSSDRGPCDEDNDCTTDVCFAGECRCNVSTNDGCPAGKNCVVYQDTPNDPPRCVPVETNDQCFVNDDCRSKNCVGVAGAKTCKCNPVTNVDCPAGTWCWGNSLTCIPLRRIDESCEKNQHCITQNCHKANQSDQAGVCRCNVSTDAGCDPGVDCGVASGFPAGSKPYCLLKLDELGCSKDEECETGACWEEFDDPDGSSSSPEGKCVCNTQTNSGCSSTEACQADAAGGASCFPLGEVRTGCERDSDCLAGLFCYQPPAGECRCVPNTSGGCDPGKECKQSGSTPPVCAPGGWGAECYADEQCEYLNCYGTIGIPGQPHCRCNVDTNAGCENGMWCGPVNGLGTDSEPICHLALSRNDGCDHDFQCSGGDRCVDGVCKCVSNTGNRGLTGCNRRDLAHSLLRGA